MAIDGLSVSPWSKLKRKLSNRLSRATGIELVRHDCKFNSFAGQFPSHMSPTRRHRAANGAQARATDYHAHKPSLRAIEIGAEPADEGRSNPGWVVSLAHKVCRHVQAGDIVGCRSGERRKS